MTPLFTKLNLGAHREILVIGAPERFEPELDALDGVTIHRDAGAMERITFVMAFVTTLEQIRRASAWLPKASGDAVVWFAYPKGTSTRYRCAFNRDTGWASLGAAGFEGVRQVAIDEDWSALRFRRVEFIRSLTRDGSRAISRAGKERAGRRGANSGED